MIKDESKENPFDLPRTNVGGSNTIPVNASNERIDPYDKLPTIAQKMAFKARSEYKKPCNAAILQGHCINGAACSLDHEPYDGDALHFFKFLVRKQKCSRKGACRVRDCARGHHCQEARCRDGKKPGCKFSASSHSMDKRVVRLVPAEEVGRSENGERRQSIPTSEEWTSSSSEELLKNVRAPSEASRSSEKKPSNVLINLIDL